jgi:hypothetical protein
MLVPTAFAVLQIEAMISGIGHWSAMISDSTDARDHVMLALTKQTRRTGTELLAMRIVLFPLAHMAAICTKRSG